MADGVSPAETDGDGFRLLGFELVDEIDVDGEAPFFVRAALDLVEAAVEGTLRACEAYPRRRTPSSPADCALNAGTSTSSGAYAAGAVEENSACGRQRQSEAGRRPRIATSRLLCERAGLAEERRRSDDHCVPPPVRQAPCRATSA